MIIAEIGINHMGSYEILEEYIDVLSKIDIDAISIQVRESSFYKDEKWKIFKISDKDIVSAIRKIKATGKKVCVANCDTEKFRLFDTAGADFFKILSKDFSNESFMLSMLSKTDKPLFFSTGTSGFDQIDAKLAIIGCHKNQFRLIHTRLSNSVQDVNLLAIKNMRKRYGDIISFGCHCANTNVLYAAVGFKPSDYFFYVKFDDASETIEYPDNFHAIPMSMVGNLVRNIRDLQHTIGRGLKTSSRNTIEGQE